MSEDKQDQNPKTINYRTEEEVLEYLKRLQDVPFTEIALKATLATEEWLAGSYTMAEDVLLGWYKTVRQDTHHDFNAGCFKPLNMKEVIDGNDVTRHLDLLGQLLMTIARKRFPQGIPPKNSS